MKLTNHQRKKLYEYWRAQGDSPKEANKKKNSIWKAFEHHARIARIEQSSTPKSKRHKPPAVTLTKTQIKEITVQNARKGVSTPDDVMSLPAKDKQKYFARVRGYLDALKEKSGRAPKKLIKQFKDNLSKAQTEIEVYKAIQESYNQGLQKKVEIIKGRKVWRL